MRSYVDVLQRMLVVGVLFFALTLLIYGAQNDRNTRNDKNAQTANKEPETKAIELTLEDKKTLKIAFTEIELAESRLANAKKNFQYELLLLERKYDCNGCSIRLDTLVFEKPIPPIPPIPKDNKDNKVKP